MACTGVNRWIKPAAPSHPLYASLPLTKSPITASLPLPQKCPPLESVTPMDGLPSHHPPPPFPSGKPQLLEHCCLWQFPACLMSPPSIFMLLLSSSSISERRNAWSKLRSKSCRKSIFPLNPHCQLTVSLIINHIIAINSSNKCWNTIKYVHIILRVSFLFTWNQTSQPMSRPENSYHQFIREGTFKAHVLLLFS